MNVPNYRTGSRAKRSNRRAARTGFASLEIKDSRRLRLSGKPKPRNLAVV
jgi:hypothetical protein